MYSRDKIANMLKKLRKENNMTQEIIEIRTGIDRTTISAYKNGTREPSLHNLMVLADIFRVNLDTIACRTNEKYINVTDVSEVALEKIHAIIMDDTLKRERYENR